MEERDGRNVATYDARLALSTILELLEVLHKQIPRTVNMINDSTDKQKALAINQISFARANISKAITQLSNAINNIN